MKYTISIGSTLQDLTGTPFETSSFSFTIHPEIRIESFGIDGGQVDEQVLTSLPGNISIKFDNPIAESSIIMVTDQLGSTVSVDYHITEDGVLVISLPENSENGDYSIDLSGIVGKDGGPFMGEPSIGFTISVTEEDVFQINYPSLIFADPNYLRLRDCRNK